MQGGEAGQRSAASAACDLRSFASLVLLSAEFVPMRAARPPGLGPRAALPRQRGPHQGEKGLCHKACP
eukprot:scaffold122107_cov39-Tisochrysis_lutea.AAC.1